MPSASDLRARLGRAAILTDFDGTLSAVVDDPAAAVPAPGAVDVLLALVDRAAVVGVVSGRPVEVLARHLPDPRIHLSGLYGLEQRAHGTVTDLPETRRWVTPVAQAGAELEGRAPAGVVVELKRLSLTVHYRRRPELEAEVKALAHEVAASHALTARPARLSIEMHPPETPDKGVVVEDLARGCDAACFLGDDVGDLAAFDALDRLREKGGMPTVKVGVESPESAPELLARSDVRVAGPEGAIGWLRSLL
ncbi:MAG TPA: trehalose-phosphatase [Acidimicrobiales bacterium]|nr:trehalose-phosphatase [Acidimicrobiales bacterium]